MNHPSSSSSSFTTPSALTAHPSRASISASSARPVMYTSNSVNSVLNDLSRQRDELRVELESLERAERQLVDHAMPPLAVKHQDLIQLSRKAQGESGIVRRQQLMLQEQQKQLQHLLQADRHEMEEATLMEVRFEQERIQKKQSFVKEMEKKNEQLAHTIGQEQDARWQILMTAEPASLFWNKVKSDQCDGGHDDGNNNNNNDDFKKVLENPLNRLTQAWTQFHHWMDTKESRQEERDQLRAFVLEHRDDEEDGVMNVTEEELMDMEKAWEQEEPQEQDPHEGSNSNNDPNEVDEDRRLMPPPPPPAHMQLFYGTQSSQPSSQPDMIMAAGSGGGGDDYHHRHHHHHMG